jgi:hypothetical protein
MNTKKGQFEPARVRKLNEKQFRRGLKCYSSLFLKNVSVFAEMFFVSARGEAGLK